MKYVYLILIVCIGQKNYAQKCIILDKDTETAIQNVYVNNEGNSKNTISDSNGIIDLNSFSEMEILTFSHVNYVEIELIKKQIQRENTIIYLQFKTELLNEVFLSASKGIEKTNRIPEQIAIYSNKEIKRSSPQTSADMLANIPGVNVQKTQFGGGSPILRGMEANRILLVVDGVRMNNAIYRKGHLQNSISISPTLLDRTEVIFGPSSVIYGSDALGGVIHYYTRMPKINEENNINTEFLSRFSTVNNEFTIQAGIELQMKKFASFTSISFSQFGDLKMGKYRSHGFQNWGRQFVYSNNEDDFYNPNPVVNHDLDKQINVGFDQTDVLQKIYIPIAEKNNIVFNLQYSTSSNINRFDKLTERKNLELKYAQWHYGPQKRFLFSTQFNLDLEKKWLNKGSITMAMQNIKESRINRKFNSLNRSSRFENVNVYSLNGDFTSNLKKSINRNLGYGFEFAFNKVNSKSLGEVLTVDGSDIIGVSDTYQVQTRYPDGGSSYMSSAVYIDYRQDVSSKTTLNSGIRLTNTHLRAKWIDESYITLPDKDITLSNTAVTLTAGYVYKPNKNWQLNGVLSSGFRSPNIDDIGKVREKNGKVTVPNINLNPEFAYNAELGLLKYFNKKNYYFGIVTYYTLLDNYIVREPFRINGKTTIVYDNEEYDAVANVNKGTAYIMGGTASFKGNLTNTINTKASLTYTKGITNDTKEPLSSIPPLFGKFEINYEKNRIETSLSIVFSGRKKLDDYNISEGIDNIEETPFLFLEQEYYGTPSWQTINFFTKYKATNSIDLLISVNNIFDQHYKVFASAISSPGRNFSFTILGSF